MEQQFYLIHHAYQTIYLISNTSELADRVLLGVELQNVSAIAFLDILMLEHS